MRSAQIQNILKENQAIFTEEYGIEKLFLFGSFAARTQTPESDLDLMYVMNNNSGMTLIRLSRIEKLVRKLTGIKKIELVNKKYINPIVYLTASRDAVEIF